MLEQTKVWKLIQRLQQLKSIDVLDVVIDRAILDSMEQYNKDQLQQGERSDGSSLPDYSETSVNVYGKPPGPIKLFETGDFYDSITTIALDNVIRFVSQPFKQDPLTGNITNLEEKYRPEIIGLTDENLEKIRAKVKIKIIKYVKKLLYDN